ncbi:hypothetical protein ABFV83_12480 [Lacrimispora sp. BS-2]|uniref:Uncharacterized protein n=1 Tax=Lacrimispora sp. BS-2 TaxID=3151850 RepID=A0AAU7PJY9_9FIRM
MRFQVKKTRSVSWILALFCCIALLFGELNVLGMDWNPVRACLVLTQALPKGYAHWRKNDAVAGFPGALEEEAGDETLVDTWSRFMAGILPLKYLAVRELFLLVPLILWSERIMMMKEGYAGRKYLIRYIHDSDGEKGVRAGI